MFILILDVKKLIRLIWMHEQDFKKKEMSTMDNVFFPHHFISRCVTLIEKTLPLKYILP